MLDDQAKSGARSTGKPHAPAPIHPRDAPAASEQAVKPAEPDAVLGQMAAVLMRSDPRLAARLTGHAHLPSRSKEIALLLVAMAARVGGLPMTLAFPFWGCLLCISGFVALAGITFAMTRHYPYSRWPYSRWPYFRWPYFRWPYSRWLSVRHLRQSGPQGRAGAGA